MANSTGPGIGVADRDILRNDPIRVDAGRSEVVRCLRVRLGERCRIEVKLINTISHLGNYPSPTFPSRLDMFIQVE